MIEITITAEQLKERAEWDQRLMREEITILDAIDICMALGVPASEYLRARFVGAVDAYQDRQIDDLAEAFGIGMTKRERNSENRKTLISHVRFHVDSFNEQGFSKAHPSYYDGAAFHEAARLLSLSPSYLYDLYYTK